MVTQNMNGRHWPGRWSWAAVAAASVIVAGCVTNPVTGESEFGFISEAQEIEMGEESYFAGRQSEGGDYRLDPELTKYVNEVGQRLAAVSDRKLPYEFVVLNSSVPNAWALPGGKIAVNRGLLTELKNEAELAAVLGHEIVHAAARHGAKSVERGTLLQIGVLAIGVATADSDYGALAAVGASLGAGLITQKYGRDAELQSDLYGMKYMARAGYDPRAAIALQETFVRLAEGKDSSWLEGLFASHPPSKERVDTNRETAKTLAAGGELGTERYRTQTAHLLKAMPAYLAYDGGRKALGKREYDKAMTLAEKAISIEPREANFYALRGDAHLKQKRYTDAVHEYGEAIRRDDRFFYHFLQRGLLYNQLGERAAAQRDLKASHDLLPTKKAANALGRMAYDEGDRREAATYLRQAADTDSEEGRDASRLLARIEPGDPNNYIRLRPYRDRRGDVWLTLTNTAPVGVRDVSIAAQYRDPKGRVWNYSTTVSRIAASGGIATVPLSFSGLPDDKALRNVSVRITRAQVE
jgi:predicted Zn-dependent protease